MLIKKDLILDKIATPVKKIQDAVLTISNCYTKKIHKKILSNTTITTSAVIMVATATI
jgi:hypothetical protein